MSDSPPAPERDSSFVPLLAVLRRRWGAIVVFTVIGIVSGVAVSATRPELFAATTTVAVTPVDTSDVALARAVATLRALLENRSITERVIQQYRLHEPPERLTPETLHDDRLRVAPIGESGHLRVSLRLRSSADVATILRHLLDEVLRHHQSVMSLELDSVPAGRLIARELDAARASLDEVSGRLRDAQQSTQVAQMQAELELSLARRARVRELAAQIAGERARLGLAERLLAQTPRVSAPTPRQRDPAARLPTARDPTIPGGPPIAGRPTRAGAHTYGGGAAGEGGGRADGTRASIDPSTAPFARGGLQPFARQGSDLMAASIEDQVIASRGRLAALEAQRADLLKDGTPSLARLYAAQAELARLELDRELAREVYGRWLERQEAIRYAAMTRSFEIRLSDTVTSPRKVSPNPALNAALGGLIGLMCAAILVFFDWRRPWQSAGVLPQRRVDGTTAP